MEKLEVHTVVILLLLRFFFALFLSEKGSVQISCKNVAKLTAFFEGEILTPPYFSFSLEIFNVFEKRAVKRHESR